MAWAVPLQTWAALSWGRSVQCGGLCSVVGCAVCGGRCEVRRAAHRLKQCVGLRSAVGCAVWLQIWATPLWQRSAQYALVARAFEGSSLDTCKCKKSLTMCQV